MIWEDIQSKLRRRLGYLFSDQQSIRSLVLDVDNGLEGFIVWNGRAVDCWAGILREVRIRHKELRLIDSALLDYPEDDILLQAKNDFMTLQRESVAKRTSTPTSDSPPVTQQTAQSSQRSNRPIDGTGPINVFISYADEDEKFKEELEKHLKLLERLKIINSFHSQSTTFGQSRQQDIADMIDAAQIILLLVSQNFLASDQLYDYEMVQAMRRHELGTACVIPIILRPTNLKDIPFEGLQALPRNGKPIGTPGNDEAWSKIVEEVRAVCNKLRNITNNR